MESNQQCSGCFREPYFRISSIYPSKSLTKDDCNVLLQFKKRDVKYKDGAISQLNADQMRTEVVATETEPWDPILPTFPSNTDNGANSNARDSTSSTLLPNHMQPGNVSADARSNTYTARGRVAAIGAEATSVNLSAVNTDNNEAHQATSNYQYQQFPSLHSAATALQSSPPRNQILSPGNGCIPPMPPLTLQENVVRANDVAPNAPQGQGLTDACPSVPPLTLQENVVGANDVAPNAPQGPYYNNGSVEGCGDDLIGRDM